MSSCRRSYPGRPPACAASRRARAANGQRRPSPLFPFGHGLSYTRFHYANVRTLAPRVAGARGNPPARDGSVRVQIRNVGDEMGTEVVQVYHGRLPGTGQATPPQQLLGWARVTLDPTTARR